MKKIILILLIVHCSLLIANAQWIQQNSGTNQSLYDIEFINDKTGWAVGDAGVVIKTTNGGTNWLNVPNPSAQYGGLLWSVCPVDSEVVYVVAGYDFIMKTSNGGTNWNVINVRPGSATAFKGLYFLNRDTGWFIGTYKVFRTYDGGNTLDSFYTPWSTNYDIFFKDINTGIFTGDGRLYKSTDGGKNWNNTNVSPGIFYMFRKLAVVNDKVWLLSSGDAPVFHSTNFGDTWNTIDTINCYPPSVMFCVAFANEMTGWAGGTFNWLYKTTNGGYDWNREETGIAAGFWTSIYCYSDSIVWGAGGNGKIWSTTTGGQTLVGVISNVESSPKEFSLLQNFPNPFNSETKFRFQIVEKDNYKMEVYNISGELISLIFDKEFNPGEYEWKYNSKELSSGIYFYQLTSAKNSIQKKFILLK